MLQSLIAKYNTLERNSFAKASIFEGLAPLLLRLYLVPVFWMAGVHKIDLNTLMPYESTVAWFGNADWGLGLPLPTFMAFMAGWVEIIGAILLAVGLAVRWVSIPLMVTMLVAAVTVHAEFGWQAIADPAAAYANDRVVASVERLAAAKSILQEHGNYQWLSEKGSLVILNNGVEFAATYFIMLFSLFFTGGGRFTSMDYFLCQRFKCVSD